MTAFSWTPRPRPMGMTADIPGVRCRCRRTLYTNLPQLSISRLEEVAEGRVPVSELEFCRGCDERTPDCWCPEVPL